ncbi:PAS domain S-box protein [bacterium]|nr:PAS domain S-box protein [bacterium]
MIYSIIQSRDLQLGLKMLGISDQEIKGKQCWQLVHGLSEPFENCPIVRMKKSKQPESMIFQEGDRWLEVSVDPIFDDTGQIKGAVHVVSDVTKRKKAKEALYESERKYRKLVENIEEGIASVDENEKFIYVNHAAIKIFGYSEKELLKKSLKDLSTSNEYKRIIEQTSIRKTGKTSRYELNIIKKNGTNAIISVTSSPLFDSHKKYLGAFGIFSDITERKQAEEALRESEEKYKMMFETAKDAVFISDENGKFMDVNQMACESLGYSKEELLKLSNKEIDADPRGYEAFLEIRNGTKEKVTFEVNQRRKDGTLLPVEITGSFFTSGGQRIALAIARDITERLSAEQAGKQAEEDIRRSAAYTRSLIEASLDPLVTIDPGGKITDVNKAIEIATGRTRKEIIGSDFSNYFTEPAKAKEGYKQVFKKGIVRDYSLEIKHKNGSVISVLYNASLYKDESGKVIGIFAAARDITKHKKAEDKLERLSRQYELILNSINEGIYGVDMQGNTTFINPAVESITGFGTKELIGHHQHDILHYLKPDGSHYPSEECPIYMAFKDGLVHHVTDEIFWRKNGTSFPVEYTATPIRKQGKIVGSVVVFRDITERKKMEEEKETLEYQLRQSQKLESIGTLAGGVAHDFNNLLTIIQGRTQLLLLDTNENDPKSRDLRQILDASTRAASLTRQLLLFSRKETMEMKTVNLNQTINNLLKMLNRLIGEDLSVKTILTPELWSVEADEGNLEQVIMNLTVNARDAMPDGGILTIQTENLQLSEKDCKIIPESNTGHFVRLMIEDTGTGIPKDIIDKIFDPFFSTKAVGKGTGLGLSVVYGIVKKHNGWINVYSETDQGTTFKIYLPATKSSAQEKINEKDITIELLNGNGERVLLIEDDPGVLKYAESALRQFGYSPFPALDGKQAIAVFQQEAGNFDLILSDVVLPDINGLDLVVKLTEEHPGIPVIMCSGYTEDKVKQSIINNRGFGFVQKPYKVHELLKIIKETITGRD